MTVSDYIVEFLISKGIKHTYGYQGGMIAYLFDSLKKYEDKISYHVPYHESGGSFAACGGAQATGKCGFCFVTSGPGFTNALTGMANAFCDSIPVIYIAGQVNFKDKKHGMDIRQKGFQEILMAEIARPVCKKSYDIDTADQMVIALNEAYEIATTGRKGPVFLDIPINVFREYVEVPDFFEVDDTMFSINLDLSGIETIIDSSLRPIILAGAGIRQSGCIHNFRNLVDSCDIPVVTSMLSVDVLPTSNIHNFGFVGPDGIRCANYLIDQSDCIISLGARLDPRQTGYNTNVFAPEAKLIRVDIDEKEFTRKIKADEIDIRCDLRDFFKSISLGHNKDHLDWLSRCNIIKEELSGLDENIANYYIKHITSVISDDSNVFLDVGKNQLWGSQSVVVKEKTGVYSSGGFGSMGYSLPAAIGACFETGRPTYTINGDGGIQMNIQEFQTIAKNNLPVKIIVINNHALANVVIFQDRWLESRYVGTMESQKDYYAADVCQIANAYGIKAIRLRDVSDIDNYQEDLLDMSPLLVEFEIPDRTPVLPDIAADRDPLRFDGRLSEELIERIENLAKGDWVMLEKLKKEVCDVD